MFIDSGADALRSQFAPDIRRETVPGAKRVRSEVETPSTYWRSIDLGDSDVQLAAFLLRQPPLTGHTLRRLEESIEVIGSETTDDDGLHHSPGESSEMVKRRDLNANCAGEQDHLFHIHWLPQW